MKKTFLLIALCFTFLASANAQWSTHASGSSNPNYAIYALSAPNASTIWGVGIDTTFSSFNTEFTRSTDGGLTWTTGNINPALFMHQVAGISAVDANTAWAVVLDLFGSQGKIYKTTNGGQSWTRQGNSAFAAPDGSPTGIHFFDASNGVAFGDPNGGFFEIQTTSNGGSTWNRVPQASLPANSPNEYSLDIINVVGNNIWFPTDHGRIYHSADKGLTWTAYPPSGTYSIYSLSFSDAQNGLMVTDAGLSRTTDGGQTWTPVTYSGTIHLRDMTHVPGAPGTYVSVGNDFDAGSSYTSDHGNTWTDLENNLHHMVVKFVSPTAGWSGGITGSTGTAGTHRFTATVLSAPKTLNPKLISVYPNPGNGEFNLRMDELQAKKVSVKVTNAIGSEVLTLTDLSAGQYELIQLDMRRQPKGMYFLSVKADDRVHSQKLIVR